MVVSQHYFFHGCSTKKKKKSKDDFILYIKGQLDHMIVISVLFYGTNLIQDNNKIESYGAGWCIRNNPVILQVNTLRRRKRK